MKPEEKIKILEIKVAVLLIAVKAAKDVFMIEGVTRAFTHQLVRHRVGTSFAQQTQRAVDMSEGFDYLATGGCDKDGPAA